MSLPHDPKERKNVPMARGLLHYFPDALAAVAGVSRVGNEQHNPGQPIHWAKHLSTDHADCIVRHLLDAGTIDTDGLRHSAKVAWRALALLQIEIEAEEAGVSVEEYLTRLIAAAAEPSAYEAEHILTFGVHKTKEMLKDLYGAKSVEPSKAEPGEFDVVCRQPCRCDMGCSYNLPRFDRTRYACRHEGEG